MEDDLHIPADSSFEWSLHKPLKGPPNLRAHRFPRQVGSIRISRRDDKNDISNVRMALIAS